jgi:zinc transport system ATP-binding protein
MYSVIRDLNRVNGITVIMISHDIEAAAANAAHILHLGSNTAFFGTSEEYLKSNIGKSFLGDDITGTIPRGDYYG